MRKKEYLSQINSRNRNCEQRVRDNNLYFPPNQLLFTVGLQDKTDCDVKGRERKTERGKEGNMREREKKTMRVSK